MHLQRVFELCAQYSRNRTAVLVCLYTHKHLKDNVKINACEHAIRLTPIVSNHYFTSAIISTNSHT